MTPTKLKEGQNFTSNLISKVMLQPSQLNMHAKVEFLSVETMAAHFQQLQNTFVKVRKAAFLIPKSVKNDPLKSPSGNIFDRDLDFRSHF